MNQKQPLDNENAYVDSTNGAWCEMTNYDRTLLRNMMTNKECNPARCAIAIVDGETKICDNDEHVQVKTHATHTCMCCTHNRIAIHMKQTHQRIARDV